MGNIPINRYNCGSIMFGILFKDVYSYRDINFIWIGLFV